jgi:pimeloyl-ACP methyl ester carboxylesterase
MNSSRATDSRGVWPAIIRIMAAALAAFALLIGAMALFQDRLLYQPMSANLSQIVPDRFAAWPDTTRFRGLLTEPRPRPGGVRGTAIVFHGNAGHAGHRIYYERALTPLGLRVILAEYPGYGPRDGELGEASLVADAIATIALAHQQFGAPLLVVGESLGAGVAAAAANAAPDRVTGLLLITPWDRLASVATYHYSWLPARWLLQDRYDNAANLAGFGKPVVVAIAPADTIVPARFGQMLYDALAHPKRLMVMPGAGHNDWPDRVDSAWWREAVAVLLPGNAGSGPGMGSNSERSTP